MEMTWGLLPHISFEWSRQRVSTLKLLSVNTSQAREISHEGMAFATGNHKTPVQGRVMLRAFKLVGDGQADLQARRVRENLKRF
jgi:hypothetical protein